MTDDLDMISHANGAESLSTRVQHTPQNSPQVTTYKLTKTLFLPPTVAQLLSKTYQTKRHLDSTGISNALDIEGLTYLGSPRGQGLERRHPQ